MPHLNCHEKCRILNQLFPTQNVSVARFARFVEWDFFCDFQTPCDDVANANQVHNKNRAGKVIEKIDYYWICLDVTYLEAEVDFGAKSWKLRVRVDHAIRASAIYQAQRFWRPKKALYQKRKLPAQRTCAKAHDPFNISTRWTKFLLKKMLFFVFLSLAISIVVGTLDSDYDYESYDNLIVTPLIGGESEFPAIDSVSFFSYF